VVPLGEFPALSYVDADESAALLEAAGIRIPDRVNQPISDRRMPGWQESDPPMTMPIPMLG
jgi:3',5'-cyclic-AMP phosphodiesterase